MVVSTDRCPGRRHRILATTTAIAALAAGTLVSVNAAFASLRTAAQKDTAAEELTLTAQVAIETLATDHNGNYAAANGKPSALHAYEPLIPIRPSGKGLPYLSTVRSTSQSYTVTITSASGDTFSVTRAASGKIVQSCTPRHGNRGKCLYGRWH